MTDKLVGTVTTDVSNDGKRLVQVLSDEFTVEVDTVHEDGQTNFLVKDD